MYHMWLILVVEFEQVNWMFLSIFTAIAIVGLFIGTFISKKTNTQKLKILFGVIISFSL